MVGRRQPAFAPGVSFRRVPVSPVVPRQGLKCSWMHYCDPAPIPPLAIDEMPGCRTQWAVVFSHIFIDFVKLFLGSQDVDRPAEKIFYITFKSPPPNLINPQHNGKTCNTKTLSAFFYSQHYADFRLLSDIAIIRLYGSGWCSFIFLNFMLLF